MASNKKAQLAIFMILGITAVMLIGLAVYGAGNADSDRLSSKQKQIEERKKVLDELNKFHND